MITKILALPGQATAALLASQGRLSYRRMLVFGVACALLWKGVIPPEAWLWVAVAYIGGDALEKAAGAIRGV
jgi:hypothetical protein